MHQEQDTVFGWASSEVGVAGDASAGYDAVSGGAHTTSFLSRSGSLDLLPKEPSDAGAAFASTSHASSHTSALISN